MERNRHFNTNAVHFVDKQIERNTSKARPIYQTSAFVFESLTDMEQYFTGEKEFLYSRYGNPNTNDLGEGIALLEGAESGVATSSGMSAIMCAILSVCKTGDHLIAMLDVYGGTYSLLEDELNLFGIEVSFVLNLEELNSVIKKNTKAIFCESITNPLVRVEDLPALIKKSKEHELVVIADNTFATPYLIQPFVLGADLVVHSATKYIGGHSDVTAGVITGSSDLVEIAKKRVISMGCNLSPFEAWLACRGLKTLSLRMDRQCANAKELASYLKSLDEIDHVYYPENVSSKGNGAMLSIQLAENIDVDTFFKSFSFVKIAPTLAGVETSISYPLHTSHRSVPQALRDKLGIGKQHVRVSVGIEDSRDIRTDFQKALTIATK
ncbi:LOW QUALITY PROTEIN: O-acetylhomoserine sulfhydrylase [Bacillus sp. JCM 19046]|nr:LOW QUALITY PROTEIN: O-acetylhomoserine sulfhydrylase [Bacillus sp. JCM 19045]GAF17568.1 LOW QUALITY PROTEIN: O-acetylhomoserine sulfhydrylase [Bacillus sp. JCM 19046]